jgi:hypothetical protein
MMKKTLLETKQQGPIKIENSMKEYDGAVLAMVYPIHCCQPYLDQSNVI